MKILLIGFLAPFGWSAVATHFFVCKIKGLCNDVETIEISPLILVANIPGDTLNKPLVKEKEVVPGKLLIYFEFDKSEFKSDSMTYKYGEKEPADDNTTTSGRANNRRTVITIKN
jgi:hypothetical protein